ncbi:MAG: hypothetical protein HY078_15270 [Elusimicrobia bacterium]|nr:hypothetical protein [Elusimicrobiota bacterium]
MSTNVRRSLVVSLSILAAGAALAAGTDPAADLAAANRRARATVAAASPKPTQKPPAPADESIPITRDAMAAAFAEAKPPASYAELDGRWLQIAVAQGPMGRLNWKGIADSEGVMGVLVKHTPSPGSLAKDSCVFHWIRKGARDQHVVDRGSFPLNFKDGAVVHEKPGRTVRECGWACINGDCDCDDVYYGPQRFEFRLTSDGHLSIRWSSGGRTEYFGNIRWPVPADAPK